MKKIVKVIVSMVMVLLCAWFILSWIDIAADNTQPNSQHHKCNMFALVAQQTRERETIKAYGDLPEGTDEITFATVYTITENSVIFETIEGELYETYVSCPSEFKKEGFYCLLFHGDEIVKAFVECW